MFITVFSTSIIGVFMSGQDHLVRMFRSHSVFTEQQSLFKFLEHEAEGVLVVLLCGMLTCQVVSKVVLETRLLQPESEALFNMTLCLCVLVSSYWRSPYCISTFLFFWGLYVLSVCMITKVHLRSISGCYS